MKIINATPHSVTLCGVEIPASGLVARATERAVQIGTVDLEDGLSVPVLRIEYGSLSGLPDEQADTVYIVSAIAAQAARAAGRNDCYVVARTVRDASGRIAGAEALAKL